MEERYTAGKKELLDKKLRLNLCNATFCDFQSEGNSCWHHSRQASGNANLSLADRKLERKSSGQLVHQCVGQRDHEDINNVRPTPWAPDCHQPNKLTRCRFAESSNFCVTFNPTRGGIKRSLQRYRAKCRPKNVIFQRIDGELLTIKVFYEFLRNTSAAWFYSVITEIGMSKSVAQTTEAPTCVTESSRLRNK